MFVQVCIKHVYSDIYIYYGHFRGDRNVLSTDIMSIKYFLFEMVKPVFVHDTLLLEANYRMCHIFHCL